MTLRPTIRLRLTGWYAAIFLVCGAALLGLSYYVVQQEFEPQIERSVGTPTVMPRGPRGGEEPAPSGKTPETTAAEQPAQVEQRVREEVRQRDERALRHVLAWFGAFLGAFTLAALLVGWIVAGRALSPMSRITETAKRISGRRLDQRIALDGPRDELRELADTFDEMLARLDATFASHRRFVANASHELRTPLSILRAELEELHDTGPMRPDQQAMLANARRAVARSEDLIDALLTLARCEGDVSPTSSVDLAEVVRLALASGRCDPAHDIEIRTDLHSAVVDGHPALLETMVANLVENGIRHNIPGGEVSVFTGPAGQAELVVSNTGPHVARDSVDELFAPFSRGERSRASDHGFGVGLSIVRAVATAHGGTVVAEARDGGGLRVVVRLPMAGCEPGLGQAAEGAQEQRDAAPLTGAQKPSA